MRNLLIGLALNLISCFIILRWPVKPSAYRPIFVLGGVLVMTVNVILVVVILIKVAKLLYCM